MFLDMLRCLQFEMETKFGNALKVFKKLLKKVLTMNPRYVKMFTVQTSEQNG